MRELTTQEAQSRTDRVLRRLRAQDRVEGLVVAGLGRAAGGYRVEVSAGDLPPVHRMLIAAAFLREAAAEMAVVCPATQAMHRDMLAAVDALGLDPLGLAGGGR